MNFSWVTKRCVLLAVICATGVGCHQEPPPVQPPQLTFKQSVFVGSALAGPINSPAPDFSDADVLELNVRWFALEKNPVSDLLPLDSQSQFTTAPLAATPVLSLGKSTRQLRFGTGSAVQTFMSHLRHGALGKFADIGNQTGNFAPLIGVKFSTFAPSPNSPIHGVSLTLSHDASANRSTTKPVMGDLTVTVEYPVADSSTLISETALLAIPIDRPHSFALIIPWTSPDGHWKAIVAYGQFEKPTTQPATPTPSLVLKSQLKPATQPTSAPVIANARPTLEDAFNLLRRSGDPRSTLFFLASSTHSEVAMDFIVPVSE